LWGFIADIEIIGLLSYRVYLFQAVPLSIFDMVVVSICGLNAILQFGSLGFMVTFQSFLVMHNMTNIEYVCCKGMAPACHFDRGVKANTFHACGKNPLWWLLPVAHHPAGSGVTFSPPNRVRRFTGWKATDPLEPKLEPS